MGKGIIVAIIPQFEIVLSEAYAREDCAVGSARLALALISQIFSPQRLTIPGLSHIATHITRFLSIGGYHIAESITKNKE
ncbi:10687_t:CDS:2 [Paraglomus occultum]|uniref:10687_t:CDS:1 n=1 Tax=Paraglomus occultum TaxID=144539 RepID=A0A9N9GKJ1_9GLOM|nr:10687_t:CDS:2 [Paraglomus occultum]